MSSTRSRNRYCLSLDNSASSTPRNTAYLNRWSEVVPPKTALTFAALWDPEEGMVTFSGAELLESESLSGIPSHIFDDDYAQYISVDRDADDITITGENTATLATFQDAFKAFLQSPPSDSKGHPYTRPEQDVSCCLQTRASSTFDGLDLYSHDVQLKPKRSVRLSRMDLLDMESLFHTSCESARYRLGSELMHDLSRPGSAAESGSGGRPANLGSRFSTTTTSSTNYADVTNSAMQSTHICETTFVPQWIPPIECLSPAASPTASCPSLPRRGVLRKRRRDGDATPTGTGSLPSTPRKASPWTPSSPSPSSPSPSCQYPSTTTTVFSSSTPTVRQARRRRLSRSVRGPIAPAPTPPASPSKSSRLKLRLTFLPRWKSRQTSPDEDGWVCIDVTPIIRQRFVADLDEE